MIEKNVQDFWTYLFSLDDWLAREEFFRIFLQKLINKTNSAQIPLFIAPKFVFLVFIYHYENSDKINNHQKTCNLEALKNLPMINTDINHRHHPNDQYQPRKNFGIRYITNVDIIKLITFRISHNYKNYKINYEHT